MTLKGSRFSFALSRIFAHFVVLNQLVGAAGRAMTSHVFRSSKHHLRPKAATKGASATQ